LSGRENLSKEGKMKTLARFLLGIFIFFSLVMANSNENQKAEWKGKIEKEVETVECSKTPLYGILKLNLTSPLIIGSETDARYFFTSLREIKVDKKGRIYVLDSKAARIQVYDIAGKFISTIGGKGQGPGEFFAPSSFFVNEKGNIYIYDTMTRKITVFSEDWIYKEFISLNEIAHGKFSVDKKGNILFNTVAFEPDGNMYISFIKLRPKENIKKKYISALFLKPIIDGKRRFIYEHPYQQNIYFSLLGNGNIALVKSLEPTIYYFSGEGEILSKVLKEEKSERITKKEKEIVFTDFFKQMRKGLHDKVFFPESRPIYSNLLIDDENRIYLERFKPINEKSSDYFYYVFNEKGKYLYNLVLNFRIECIKSGYVYTIKINEESGEIKLLRYKIKNWELIKRGI